MTTQKEPSPEALANVTEKNIETRSQLLPEEKSLQGSRMEEVARAGTQFGSRRISASECRKALTSSPRLR